MTRVKICGLTRVEDAVGAARAGADAIGFVFWSGSPRAALPEVAALAVKAAVAEAGRPIESVGVFVREDPRRVEEIVRRVGLDWAQLHGDEDDFYLAALAVPAYPVFRASSRSGVRDAGSGTDGARSGSPFEVEREIRRRAPRRFLLDAYRADLPGGTGDPCDWDLARRVREVGDLWLAGGLSARNVARALDVVRPAGVDVSSAVEVGPGSAGVKDEAKVGEFIEEVRRWERAQGRAGSQEGAGSAGSSEASTSPRP